MRTSPSAPCLLAAGVLAIGNRGLAQPAEHGFHPPMPDQKLYFYCHLDGGAEPVDVHVPLKLTSPSAPAELDQVVTLPTPLPPVSLKQYLPKAVLEQRAVPDEGPDAGRAVQVSIDGPSQSFRRWLVANDVDRNRLVSFIGTWRYMAVDDPRQRGKLLEQFENELTRSPVVLIQRTDTGRSAEVPAVAGTVSSLPALDCTVRVREFLPDFAFDNKTNQPVKKSDKRVNPAVKVVLERNGTREERWAFAKFPQFRSGSEDKLPFRVTLDCPLEKQGNTPDFMLVTVGVDAHEVWTRLADEVTAKALSLGEPVEITGSQYTFQLADYIPSGRLVEHYSSSQGRDTVTALQVEIPDASGAPKSFWLELGKQRVVPTAGGPITLAFGPQRVGSAGRHR
jgi:hypothetical protein